MSADGDSPGAGPADSLGSPARQIAGPLAGLSFSQFLVAWNTQEGRDTPDLHLRIAKWLDGRWAAGDRRLLLMVFRDAGKSTLVGLFCAWLLGQDPNLRVLVLSAEAGLATKMTRNVRRVLERNRLTRHLLPKRREEWAAGQFTVDRSASHRDPSLLARSIGANITGCRADIVICDDVEVPRTADTHHKRGELRERLRETSFVLTPDGTQLYIGTPHSYYSIYAEEACDELGEASPFLASYVRLKIPMVDPALAGVWPDRFAPPAIDDLQRDAGPNRFRSQMMLTPAQARESRLDPDRLVRYEAQLELREAGGEPLLLIDGRRMVGVACCWDPAMGRPERGDASVIAAVFADDAGGYWLHAIRYLQVDEHRPGEPDLARQLCRQVADFARAFHLPSVRVETNGIGTFLPGTLRQVLAEERLAVTVIEVAASVSKATRIMNAFDPVLAAHALRAHASVWETPFIREMREWRPGAGRDDGLDAVGACLLHLPLRLGARAPTPPRRDWRHGTLHRATTMLDG
ncbi:MAG: phage terminase large subunit [Geminicoccaceae bacterium]